MHAYALHVRAPAVLRVCPAHAWHMMVGNRHTPDWVLFQPPLLWPVSVWCGLDEDCPGADLLVT